MLRFEPFLSGRFNSLCQRGNRDMSRTSCIRSENILTPPCATIRFVYWGTPAAMLHTWRQRNLTLTMDVESFQTRIRVRFREAHFLCVCGEIPYKTGILLSFY